MVRSWYVRPQRLTQTATQRNGQGAVRIERIDHLCDFRSGFCEKASGKRMRAMPQDDGREARISSLTGGTQPDDQAVAILRADVAEQRLRERIVRRTAIERLLRVDNCPQAEPGAARLIAGWKAEAARDA